MSVKIKLYEDAIKTRIKSGTELATIAVTEAVVEYGNIFVREDQGTLKDSALKKSQPKKGLAIWDTDYAKRVYYTGTPSKDVNANASLMWAQKGIDTHKTELQEIAQNAYRKGMG